MPPLKTVIGAGDDVNALVSDRMRLLDRPPSTYVQTMEEVIFGHALSDAEVDAGCTCWEDPL